MTSQITFIGLGNLGAALAQVQLKAGADLTVWNRTPDRPVVAELVSAGARFEQSLAKAIEASPITIICVINYDNIHQILDPISSPGANPLAAKTVINLTSGTPRDGERMKEWMHGQGVRAYVDGGVMAAPYMIGGPQSFVFYCGTDEKTFQTLKPMLELFGRADYYGEDAGRAARFDLALLSSMYGMFMGVLMAISMLRSQGEKLEPAVKDLVNPLLQAFLASNVKFAAAVDSGEYGSHGHPMGMQSAVMQNLLKAFKEDGVNPEPFRSFFDLVKELVEAGGGDSGMAAMADKLRLSQ